MAWLLPLVDLATHLERELKIKALKNPLNAKISLLFIIEKMDYVAIYKKVMDLGFCNLIC